MTPNLAEHLRSAKDAANRKKHGISLAEGDGVLDDPLAEPKEIRAYEKGL